MFDTNTKRQPGQGNTASEGNLHEKWLQQAGYQTGSPRKG
jgi:hypothetical protein